MNKASIRCSELAKLNSGTAATQNDVAIQRTTDLDLNKAHNIFFFRFNEDKWQRELRIVKMEGCEHPLEWIPFKITRKGIELLKV